MTRSGELNWFPHRTFFVTKLDLIKTLSAST